MLNETEQIFNIASNSWVLRVFERDWKRCEGSVLQEYIRKGISK